jgi:hypothetical protein
LTQVILGIAEILLLFSVYLPLVVEEVVVRMDQGLLEVLVVAQAQEVQELVLEQQIKVSLEVVV